MLIENIHPVLQPVEAFHDSSSNRHDFGLQTGNPAVEGGDLVIKPDDQAVNTDLTVLHRNKHHQHRRVEIVAHISRSIGACLSSPI